MKSFLNFQYFGFLFVLLLLQACGNSATSTEQTTPTPVPTETQEEQSASSKVEVEIDPNAPPFIIHYTSPKNKIIISESTLTHYQKEEHFDKGSVSATPKSYTTNTVADKIPLQQAQIKAIQEVLSNGFMQLNADYGAPAHERHYPFFINVSFNGENKEVLYRSNPSYESAPEEFRKVEAIMFEVSLDARKK